MMEKKNENAVQMSSPWVSHVHKMQAFFKRDPDIRLEYDDGKRTVKLYVNGQDKAEALYTILPDNITFGTECLKIEVIPENKSMALAETFRKALESNALYSQSYEIRPEGTSNAFTYVMFEPSVVQYWDDNLGDPHGTVSVLAQDLAKDIFMYRLGALYSTEELRGYYQ